ncbi:MULTISPECIES: hypothetical protein [Polymorphospora]|uniref:Uncharacterized protein n=1 Tax=Polymorphospora lycopeni TaxID=3140240 RepID=A0ABV5CWB9_9ACTN
MDRRFPPTRLLTVLTGAVVAALIAGGIAVAATGRDSGHDHADHAHLDTASGLLVTTRSDLRMCVEAGPRSDAPDSVRTVLLTALDRARQAPGWSGAYGRFGYDPATAVHLGCPAPALPERYDRTVLAGPGLTDDPSAYRVWVYVLDDPTADRVLGPDRPAGAGTAELMREAGNLFPVSTALLVRQSRFADPTALAQDLREALGLEPRAPDQIG